MIMLMIRMMMMTMMMMTMMEGEEEEEQFFFRVYRRYLPLTGVHGINCWSMTVFPDFYSSKS